MPSDTPEKPAEPEVLASDAEREQVVARLNEAVSEGRLTLSEFSDRTAAVYTTRTRSELGSFVKDLPAPASVAASQLVPAGSGSSLVHGSGSPGAEQLSVGAIKRNGRWRLPSQSDMYVALGTIKLDLRDAQLESAEVEVRARTGIGTIKVVVPEHIRVVVDGGTQLGTRTIDENHIPQSVPAPTVRLRLDTGVGTVKVYVVPEGRKRRYF